MGFLKEMRRTWKEMTTAEKIGVGIDLVCGAGAALIGRKVGDKLCEGCDSKLERVLIRVTATGAVAAGAEAGSKYLKREYGDTTGLLIDAATGKAKLNGIRPTKDGIELEGEYHE